VVSRPKRLLVDTDVVSNIFLNRPLASHYIPILRDRTATISYVTMGELFYGAELAGWGRIRWRKLESELLRFAVLGIDEGVARAYARIVAGRRRIGRPIAPNDTWIAACALRHDLPLVTHNRRDFDGIPGLEVISEA